MGRGRGRGTGQDGTSTKSGFLCGHFNSVFSPGMYSVIVSFLWVSQYLSLTPTPPTLPRCVAECLDHRERNPIP